MRASDSSSIRSAAPADGIASLIHNYKPGLDRHDELVDAQGQVRPHWRWLVDALATGGDRSIAQLQRQTNAVIRENGITYNVYGDPRGMDRPWTLDALPVLLSGADWTIIEAGMIQRSRLLNKIAADLYGPQRLLRDRVLPPEIIYANRLFQRACKGIVPSRFGHIPQYAADLIRAPDGRWIVCGDRLQAASGAGYALENRAVLSRTLPNLISEGHVRRLSDYFEHFREMLNAMAPSVRENATVALWSPGPLNEVYFEHVFLAKYLGFPLIEGGDVTVRDNRVFLKTICGLEPIDVVLRRVDDAFCDPLELRRDSTLGITGLLHASRFGHLNMCNAIGSAALEVPAVAAMLPLLCRHLLSEELLLPSAAAHWGGYSQHREWIDAAFDHVRLAPAFGHSGDPAVVPSDLPRDAYSELRRRWDARPYEFVAMDAPPPSTVPVWSSGTLIPQSLTLRAFAVGGGSSAHARVLPGGLARYNETVDSLSITMQRGGGSKDIWVLSDGAADFRNAAPINLTTPAICRSPSNLPSRLAENLTWLGRYCDRAEHTVRFLRHTITRCLEEEDLAQDPDLLTLVETSPHLFAAKFRQLLKPVHGTPARSQELIIDSVYDESNPDSVMGNVLAIRRTAWIVRERFADDDWRIVNGFSDEFLGYGRNDASPGLGTTLYALNQLIKGFAAFSGLMHENMTREPGQVFLGIGRRIERAIVTARLLSEVFAANISSNRLLRSALAICDSPLTYRARYGKNIHRSAVLDLLLCDQTNPRSVAFQIQALVALLSQLPGAGGSGLLRDEERVTEQLHTALRIADANELAQTNDRNALMTLLKSVIANTQHLAELLARRYFTHTSPARQLDASTEVSSG